MGDENYKDEIACLKKDVQSLRTDMSEGFARIESTLNLLTTTLNVPKQQQQFNVEEEYPEPVLLPSMVLKDDEFYGMHRLPSPPFPEGVLNFRQTKDHCLPIFGVHQPSAAGVCRVLDYITQELKFTRIVWINLREEPVVYISGRPCAPREPEHLNQNVEYLFSIEGRELEKMERRMRKDVLEQAHVNGGKFVVYHQSTAEGHNTKLEIDIDVEQKRQDSDHRIPGEHGVATLRDIFSEHQQRLADKDIHLGYFRIPIQDESAPEEKDFDEIVSALRNEDRHTALVFNCQMGRGRTTTGMVVASLLLNRLDPPHDIVYSKEQEKQQRTKYNANSGEYVPSRSKRVASRAFGEDFSEKEPEQLRFMRGCYVIVEHLVTVLGDGKAIKHEADAVVDACDALQNLREAIYSCKEKAEEADRTASNGHIPLTSDTSPDQSRPASFWYTRGHNYLERYWWILVFNAYVHHQSATGFRQSFSRWMGDRWGLKRMLKKLSLD